MADTVVSTQLINMALTHLGHSTITSSSELPQAQAMYPWVRDKVLSWARWRFATTRQSLVRLDTAPASGYSYQYAMPTLPYPLRTLELSCDGYPYAREAYVNPLTPDVVRQVVLTDASSVILRYVARVPESSWPPLVADTCALWLAVVLCNKITGKSPLRAQLFQELQLQIDRAILLEGHQDTPRRIAFNDTYVQVRDLDAFPRVDPSLPTPS